MFFWSNNGIIKQDIIMKIVIFTDTYLPCLNGVSASINQFTTMMADDGHQIMIFCPKFRQFRHKKHPNIIVKSCPSITAPSYKDFRLALPLIWRTVNEVKKFRPDVIHIQTPLGIGWVGIWVSKILKMKNIQTYHTYIPEFLVYLNPKNLFGIKKIQDYLASYRVVRYLSNKNITSREQRQHVLGQRFDRLAKEINLKKTNKQRLSRKASERFAGSYTRLVYDRADLVLTPSEAMKQILKKQGVEAPIEVMSNGVKYDFFTKKDDFEIKKRFIHMGRLGSDKSVEVVIKAFALAQEVDPAVRLDIYGDGPERKKLQNLSRQLKVQSKIKFLGAYDINKVAKILKNYDCFVTASTIETQGIVLLEAMSAGLPVLGVKALAVPEAIKHGVNGYLSKPADAKGLAKNMLQIIQQPTKLKALGQASLEMAKSHDANVCKEKLLAIYQKVAEMERQA